MATGDRISVGGTNWKKLIPQITKTSGVGNINHTVVNIQGSGILTGLYQSVGAGGGSANSGYVTVIVDGVTLVSDLMLSNIATYPGEYARSFGSLPIVAAFHTSLEILARGANTDSYAGTTTTVTYSLD